MKCHMQPDVNLALLSLCLLPIEPLFFFLLIKIVTSPLMVF